MNEKEIIEYIATALIVILAFAIVIGSVKLLDFLWMRNVREWAKGNDLKIEKLDTEGIFRWSPFFFKIGTEQAYRLELRDRKGVVLKCWVKTGAFSGSRGLTVKWDKCAERWP